MNTENGKTKPIPKIPRPYKGRQEKVEGGIESDRIDSLNIGLGIEG